MHRARSIIFFVLILAIASAGMSPACAFMSGKTSLIEICTADGSVKTIAVPADQAPADESSDHEKSQSGKTGKNCAFCFAQDHQKSITLADAQIKTPAGVADNGIGYAAIERVLGASPVFHPRGPPVILS